MQFHCSLEANFAARPQHGEANFVAAGPQRVRRGGAGPQHGEARRHRHMRPGEAGPGAGPGRDVGYAVVDAYVSYRLGEGVLLGR